MFVWSSGKAPCSVSIYLSSLSVILLEINFNNKAPTKPLRGWQAILNFKSTFAMQCIFSTPRRQRSAVSVCGLLGAHKSYANRIFMPRCLFRARSRSYVLRWKMEGRYPVAFGTDEYSIHLPHDSRNGCVCARASLYFRVYFRHTYLVVPIFSRMSWCLTTTGLHR